MFPFLRPGANLLPGTCGYKLLMCMYKWEPVALQSQEGALNTTVEQINSGGPFALC